MQPQNNLKTPVIMKLILRPKGYFLHVHFQIGSPYDQVYQALCEPLHFLSFFFNLDCLLFLPACPLFPAYGFLIIRGILNVSNVILKKNLSFISLKVTVPQPVGTSRGLLFLFILNGFTHILFLYLGVISRKLCVFQLLFWDRI